MTTNRYTICLLFTHNLKQILLCLLCTKAKTDYKGKLNGIGGKILPDETPETGAKRKILEETGIHTFLDFCYLGKLELPYDCKTQTKSLSPEHPACELYFYAGTVFPQDLDVIPTIENPETPTWYYIQNLHMITKNIAGDGEVQTFIQKALATLTASQYKNYMNMLIQIQKQSAGPDIIEVENYKLPEGFTQWRNLIRKEDYTEDTSKYYIVFDQRCFSCVYNRKTHNIKQIRELQRDLTGMLHKLKLLDTEELHVTAILLGYLEEQEH